MIFDDHDIRDDWNTSHDVAARRWRPPRGGTAGSSPGWRRTGSTSTSATCRPPSAPTDEIWRGSRRTTGDDELDLDRRARRVRRPRRPGAGDLPLELRARLRRPGPARGRRLPRGAGAGARPALDARRRRDGLARRADARRRRPPARSAPRCRSCSPAGLHHLEAFSEALAARRAGAERGAQGGERIRQAVRPRALGAPSRTASRRSPRWRWRWPRGEARPARRRRVTFLSGDVHHSYVCEARPGDGVPRRRCRAGSSRRSARRSATRSRATCASRRRCSSYGVAGPIGPRLAPVGEGARPRRSRGSYVKGPWFDNNLAFLEVAERGAADVVGHAARSSTATTSGRG